MLSEITGIKWKPLQLKPVESCDKSKWRIMVWTIMSCFPNQYMMLIEIDEMYIFTRVNSEHLNLAYIYICYCFHVRPFFVPLRTKSGDKSAILVFIHNHLSQQELEKQSKYWNSHPPELYFVFLY